MSQTLMVGLTGGIASGKSTVADLFKALGITIIDADHITRELVKPGSTVLSQIIDHFGAHLLQADHSLNRQALRQHVFNHPQERLWLENLLHPLVRENMQSEAAKITSPYGILMIPLLNDATHYPFIQRILVVDAPEVLQLERVQARDQVDITHAKAIVAAQLSREARLKLAHDVIENTGNLAALKQRVLQLHQQYLLLTA